MEQRFQIDKWTVALQIDSCIALFVATLITVTDLSVIEENEFFLQWTWAEQNSGSNATFSSVEFHNNGALLATDFFCKNALLATDFFSNESLLATDFFSNESLLVIDFFSKND